MPYLLDTDLIIAATALEYGLTVVTRNVHDYRDIPGLSLHLLSEPGDSPLS
jgi:predicted nucleic acid-binding protein